MAPDNAKPEAEGAPARQPDRAAAVALAPRRARVRRACQINPVSLLFGPIFDKEMRVQGRRVSTYWVRALYASGLLGLVAFVYFGLMSQIEQFSGAARTQQLQGFAPTLAIVIAWFQFVMLILIAPTLTGPCICDEKRARTLAAVMTTPMTSAQIIMGKLSSRLSQLFILILVSAPFLLGVRVFGGLEAEAVAAIMSITISSLVFVAALGILFSIGAKRSSNAAGAAIFMFILVTFGPTIAVWVYASARGISVPPPTWLFQLSAPIALGWVTRTVIAGTAMTQIRGMWLTDTGANLGAAAAVALLSTVRLRRAMLADASAGVPTSNRKRRRSRRDRRPDGRTPATTAVPGETGAMEAPETVEQHAAEEVYKERETFVGDHPVAWRECRTVLGGSRRNRWIIGGVVLVILVWLNYRVPPASDVGGHMMVVIIGSLLMLVQAAAGGAPTVAGEREAATWPALLTTTLTGFEILLGKALGAMRRLWFWLAAIVAQLCVGVLSGGLRPLVLVHVPLVLIGGAVFLSGTGVLFSLMFKKGVTAAVFNIGLAFAAWLGAPVLAMLGAEFFGSRTVSRHSTVLGWLSDSLWCINPMVLAGVAVDGAAGPDRRYDMPWGRVSAGVFTPLAMGATALGIVIGLGALIFASRLFNRFGGRSS